MALNKDEKELLAVCRYFNQQVENKSVARLVKKLSRDFDIVDVKALTGFGEREIKVLLESVPDRQARAVKKVRNDIQAEMVKLDESTGNGKVSTRTPIALDANSSMPDRVAYDISKAIMDELGSNDILWGQKEIIQRFNCKAATCSKAMQVLLKHNWIEPVNPENVRHGYKVK